MRDVKSAEGFIVARVDSSGNVSAGPEPGPVVGRVQTSGAVFDDDGGVHQVGRVDGEGAVFDSRHELVGKVDAWGRVYDPFGGLVGTVQSRVDAGVLLLLAQPPVTKAQEPGLSSSPAAAGSLMEEATELAEEHRFPGIRKDYKPLTDRDVFMEHRPRD